MEAAPVIMAQAAPTAVWFPERIDVVSYARAEGGGGNAVRKSAVVGGLGGALAGGPTGAVVGGIAAAAVATAATPRTHVEFTMVVTVQGMPVERKTRWSAAEALAVAMKDHELREVKVAAAQLPAKYFPLGYRTDSPGEDPRIQKRAQQLSTFLSALCAAWRNICAVHGPTSRHGKLFSDFFKLPGH
eukprot:COSAG06_NODE_21417_length_757_cov_1.931611_1_plen_186_part_10